MTHNPNAPILTPVGHDVRGEIETSVTIPVTVKYSREWDGDRSADPVVIRVLAQAWDARLIPLFIDEEMRKDLQGECDIDADKRMDAEAREGGR